MINGIDWANDSDYTAVRKEDGTFRLIENK